MERFIFYSTLKPLPTTLGQNLVEHRVSIFGISVYLKHSRRQKYRVALLVDEFFGGWDTAIGGYGALARKYICKYIPDSNLQIDVLLGCSSNGLQKMVVDETTLIRLPESVSDRQRWFDGQAYNLLLSIEMTEPSFQLIKELEFEIPLVYWIQDPRDLHMYQSRLKTVNRIKDGDWAYISDVAIWVQQMMAQNRINFISQGHSLSHIARRMYNIPLNVPIDDLANPVEIDFEYRLNDPPKENKVIFLGRLEAQKRVWIVCEIAKRMPQHEFYVLGATGKGRDERANAKTLEPYRNADGSSKIKNLHFVGHVEGNVKNRHIASAKLLLNTSIWEGIPVSWLEALSYGTLIVSAFDRDEIVQRFGSFIGEVMGDGTAEEDIAKFVEAIRYWMENDQERNFKAQEGINFVRDRHSIDAFTQKMRKRILDEIP